jgi:ABC-2 type transport system ATP-binding protein
MLEIKNLVKTYTTFSLGPLDLEIPTGCALGLVGANGSGKTTLFRSIMGTVSRNQGSISIDGVETEQLRGEYKNSIGYVGDYVPLFDNWTGEKNLELFSSFYTDWSTKRVKDVAQQLNLDLHQKVSNYSTGQRAKLGITIALAHKPKLLLLDEPTTGLDPISRDGFMELLFEVAEAENCAILYATHHIAEFERLADRFIFISEGRIVRDEIKEDLTESWRRISYRLAGPLEDVPNIVQRKSENTPHVVISDNFEETVSFLNGKGAESMEVSSISVEKIATEILRQSSREISHV